LGVHTALRLPSKYRKDDKSIPVKPIPKMTELQAIKELEANGFELVENIDNLPL
jgi:hypothetical protein